MFPKTMRRFTSIHRASLRVASLGPDSGYGRARVAVLVRVHDSSDTPEGVASLRLSVQEARDLAALLTMRADEAAALEKYEP